MPGSRFADDWQRDRHILERVFRSTNKNTSRTERLRVFCQLRLFVADLVEPMLERLFDFHVPGPANRLVVLIGTIV